jgi:hypothetical protein
MNGNRIKYCLQIVKTIRPFAGNMQSDIYFTVRKGDHGVKIVSSW